MKNLTIILTLVICLFFTSSCNNNVNSNNTIADTKTKKVVTVGQKNIELELTNLLNNKVSILIPKSFNIMSEEMSKLKYPSENRPSLIYTNEDGSINVAFNHTTSKTTNSNISQYKDYLKGTFKNLYPSATWYGDGTLKLNGKNVGFLELLTPAIDTKVYNLIFFTELENRLLLVTFNCTEEEMKDWKPIAKEIMNSITIN